MELGLWIPILDRIPDSKAQDSGPGFPCMGRKDIGKEVATKSLLKPPFLHSMLAHDNTYMDLSNKEKIAN